MPVNRLLTLLFAAVALGSCTAAACDVGSGCQPAPMPTRVETGLPDLLRRHMEVLAADSLEGRGSGYRGDAMAAAYIAAEFQRLGLQSTGGSFMQPFDLHARRPPQPFQVLRTQNVIGLLPGSDPTLRHELVVVGGHYDGQGIPGQADMGRLMTADTAHSSIWNSANDNASGVVAMLAVAEALAAGQRPRRSVLFIAFGAEEHGLVGSLHYVAHPVLPWNDHVAMINLEMIGWEPDRPVNVRATATSPSWNALLDSATSLTSITTTRNQPGLTNDTDHYGFSLRGVPSVHYGVGGSREHYHAVTDDASRIAYDALADRTRHIIALTQLVANRDERLAFAWEHPRDLGITGVALTPAEYEVLRLDAGAGAVKINGVASGLPAAAAGLRAGDVVISVNGVQLRRDVPGIRSLNEAAADAESILVEVFRDGTRQQLTVRMQHREP